MRTQAIIAAGLLFAFAFPTAHAQLQSRPVPNRGVESFTFQSPSMGVRFSINVGMPEDYKAGDGKKYPALLVTDGDFTFGSVYESASTLRGQITPLIIISVGTSLDEGDAETFGVGSTSSHRPAGIEKTRSARRWSTPARLLTRPRIGALEARRSS
jgi:hypothetical protein